MPELPEVRTVVRSLQPLVGWTIRQVEPFRPQVLRDETGKSANILRGRRITGIAAHGKQIWFTLDRGPFLHAHLGMTGNFRRHQAGAVRVKHAHAVFTLCKSVRPSRMWPNRPRLGNGPDKQSSSKPAGGRATLEEHAPQAKKVLKCELHFVDSRRFGGLWLVADQQRRKELGPDAYDMTRAEFERALTGCPRGTGILPVILNKKKNIRSQPRSFLKHSQGKTSAFSARTAGVRLKANAGTKRQLKALLLDQRRLAGLGNIYADESLHRAGLHPLRRADTLKPAERQKLFQAIKAVLRLAVKLGGSTLRDHRDAEGEKGWFQIRHRVYGRAGRPCKTCGTPIASAQIAGRTTCWCPKCQKSR